MSLTNPERAGIAAALAILALSAAAPRFSAPPRAFRFEDFVREKQALAESRATAPTPGPDHVEPTNPHLEHQIRFTMMQFAAQSTGARRQ